MGADRTSEEDFGMSQEDVFRWLGANPGWHRTAEVKRAVGKESSSVRGSLSSRFNSLFIGIGSAMYRAAPSRY